MRSQCTVQDCLEPVVGQGLCRKHYMRMRRKGSTDDARKNARGTCSVDGCERPHQALGLCYMHWKSDNAKHHRQVAKAREERRCAHCGAPVDLSRRRRGPLSYCSRECKDKAWVASGQNAIAARKSYFKRRYDLTPEQVEEMAVAGCAICGTADWSGRYSRPHVDHDHETGQVRGILCSECNTGLGKFRDRPDLLEAAVAYLRRG